MRNIGSKFKSNQSHPVGEKKANNFGLHDMHGNVWEWTQDCWNPTYENAPLDGSAWVAGDCTSRVVRGGSWGLTWPLLQVTGRNGYSTIDRGLRGGFRVARDL